MRNVARGRWRRLCARFEAALHNPTPIERDVYQDAEFVALGRWIAVVTFTLLAVELVAQIAMALGVLRRGV